MSASVSGKHTTVRMFAPPAGYGHQSQLVRVDRVRQTYDGTYVCPAGRVRPSNSTGPRGPGPARRLGPTASFVQRLSPAGAVSHPCWVTCFPMAPAHLMIVMVFHVIPLGVTMGTHSSLNRGAVRAAGPGGGFGAAGPRRDTVSRCDTDSPHVGWVDGEAVQPSTTVTHMRGRRYLRRRRIEAD